MPLPEGNYLYHAEINATEQNPLPNGNPWLSTSTTWMGCMAWAEHNNPNHEFTYFYRLIIGNNVHGVSCHQVDRDFEFEKEIIVGLELEFTDLELLNFTIFNRPVFQAAMNGI